MKTWISLLSFGLILQTTLASESTLQSSIQWWNAGSYRNLVESASNPDNATLLLPQWLATSELRPDLKFVHDPFVVRARPRFIGTLSKTSWGNNQSDSDASGHIQWSEAYASYTPLDRLTLTYGLQNFQWGPAESTSPSNKIFNETIQAKDVLFETRGHHLMRVNYTPLQELSEVLLVELSDNGDPQFIAEESFSKKIVLKSEYSWAGGADYAGLVLGYQDESHSWMGEYLNLEFFEGFSFYVDASQQEGSSVWYPVLNSNNTIVMAQSMKKSKHIYQYSVTGVRYVFENGNDIRLEWIFQEMGYDQVEVAWLGTALTSRNLLQLMNLQQNAARSQKNGLSFAGQDYLFTSFRFPDAFNTKDWTIYWRLLASLQDKSTSSFLSSENAIGEAGTLFATLGLTSGPAQSELRGSVDTTFTLGYRHTW